MVKKKYRVLPGYIKSKNDGDRHYISAGRLMLLYGVSSAECVIGYNGGVDGLIVLKPLYNGNYSNYRENLG